MINDTAKNFYEFDSYQVDVRRRLLLREGKPVRVTPKAFEILFCFVQSAGRVISKDEIMSTIWPDCFVEEGNLAQNIFLLRKILGERKDEHKFIITLPGVGYRFAPYVSESSQAPAVSEYAHAQGQDINCVAVLPIKPLSANDADSSLGAGISDALTTRLCRLKLFKVIPTSSVLRLMGPGEDPWFAGRDLKADVLLGGIYQRDGEQLRVSVQLIRVGDGIVLWAEKFDGKFTTRFALQDSISEQVAKALCDMTS